MKIVEGNKICWSRLLKLEQNLEKAKKTNKKEVKK